MDFMVLVKSKPELDYDEDGVVEISPDGRYIRYDEVLGSGAFKDVYKGFDQVYGIEVAWNKISLNDDVLQSPAQRERLLSEAVLVKSLKHENITKCFYSWIDNENKNINIITELFCSGSLRQYRKKHTSVDMKAIKNWGCQILRGLHYLHTHDPPIVHRDLKCDNVFVNGNHGEVKIGDLGFSKILHQGTARSVIGTPEFMAPELFEEEYDELVDIYAFGMCMLELVTCEYPYTECKNAGQIYKKVMSGVKPAALGKVKDPRVKQFIEKCLVPASQRLPAIELLKDPFLSSDILKELVCEPVLLPPKFAPKSVLPLKSMPKSVNAPKPDSQISMDIESSYGSVSTYTRSVNETTPVSTLELRRFSAKEFRLRGEKIYDNLISFSLHIGLRKVKKYNFMFNLCADSSRSIAREMVEQHGLADDEEDVAFLAELIDSLVLELVPSWKPSDYNGVKNSREERLNTPSLSLADKDHLKMELEAIDFQFQQCCRKFLRMREEAMDNAKKRWIV